MASVPFQVGQTVKASAARVEAKKTSPPARYTDATLIEDMVSVHKYVEDEKMRAVLQKTKGLGTERTRADFIEKNISDNLIVRNGKYLDASDLGIEMMAQVDDNLKDPATTALWEAALTNVEAGKTTPEVFMSSIEKTVLKMIGKAGEKNFNGAQLQAKREQTTTDPIEPLPGHGEACPKCANGKMITRKSTKTQSRFVACNAFPECKHISS